MKPTFYYLKPEKSTFMKNLILIPIVLLFILPGMKAQVALPSGMRYQAIARDSDGNIRSGEDLTVKAELMVLDAAEEVVYSETHQATSGEFGLLNITIGEGKSEHGSFSDIPWDKHVWVRISIKNAENSDFQLITTSKLYSVPYAYYAATAGEIVGKPSGDGSDNGGNRAPGTGLNSINWTLEGNYNSQNWNNGNPILGTTDLQDLVLVTNKVPRMIIDKNGMISFMVPIDMNGNLNVDGTTTLNNSLTVTGMSPTYFTGTLVVDKTTTLNSSLKVANMAPTHLTGLLDVDKTLNVDGSTTLNSTLNVTNMSATTLTGTLNVDKATLLNAALTVANMAPTQLTGSLDVDKTLNVDGATTLNNTLDVTGTSATSLTGTLTVGQATTLNDDLTVANSSPTHLTGTLDVDGTLNVDGATTLNSTLNVTGMSATTLTGTLSVDGATTLKDDLTVENAAPTHLTGSLDVDGDFNAEGEITIDGALNVTGMNPSYLTGTLEVDKLATMNAGLTVSGNGTLGPNSDHVAFFNNTEGGASDGIAIQIQNNTTNKENNFVTFYKGGNGVAGRIEGYMLNDIGQPPIPTDDEIWTAVCIAIADYNPITIMWTQFATYFNLFGTVWNGATIPAFEIPDFPGLTLPTIPGLDLPDYPGLDMPTFPGLDLPTFSGVSIPDIPSVTVAGETVFPGLTLPDIPSFDVPNIPSFDIPNIPGFVIPNIPEFNVPDSPAFVIPDMPELDLSEDLFEIPTIPSFSDILQEEGVCPDEDIFDIPNGYVYKLIEWGVQNDMQNMISFSPIDLAAKVVTWGVTKVVKSGGVTYGSQGADYAEYLPKVHPTERFMGGEIVGVHAGKISKVTEGADQILAISTMPLVLGNQPEESEKNLFEKVGFLGQVPVFVQGPVELGDFIVPSGKNDGIGRVIKANELRAEVLPEIFGTAWSANPLETTVVINVSIGLRPTEIAQVLKQREESLRSLQEQVEAQTSIHNELKQDVEMLKSHFNLEANSSPRRSK